jgi:hypothetical protein
MVGPVASAGFLVHPQAAVYDGPNNALIVVLAELSASAKKYGGNPANPAAGLRTGLLITGLTDVETFPPGDSQATMVCGKLTRNGLAVIMCEHVSKTGTIGMAMYFNGLASSVSDAASKTSQILSLVGG